MEHILVNQIMKHLESNDILSKVQYGFRSCHSYEAQLLLTTNDLAAAIDNKLQEIWLFWTFRKLLTKWHMLD